MVDGNDYNNDDNDKGSGHDNDHDEGRRWTMTDDDYGGYGGKDGHHRMRKGRRHDNKTIHNNKIGKHHCQAK